MNQKVQKLIDDRQLTIEDLLEYAQAYMDGVDKYDDEQIDKYYQEEYNPEWLSNDPNAPDYEDTQDVEWPKNPQVDEIKILEDMYGSNDEQNHPSEPEYIVAFTSYRLEETYIFQADREGKIVNYCEYGGRAKRWGSDDWEDHQLAVSYAMGNIPYRFEGRIETGMNDVHHYLYSKMNEADYWNGALPSDFGE